ncbi:MAG: PilZ domain-containing protein [Bacteriovoracaceae bacterium]|nr:PilZ domain-containing protein [Bacteriovoracaceae bacterium]
MNDFLINDLEIIQIFKTLLNSGQKVWLWQNPKDKGGSRHAHYAVVKRYDVIDKYIEVRPIEGAQFRFTFDTPVFLMSEGCDVAFQLKIRKFEPLFIAFETPQKMKIVSGDFKRGLQIVEKEDEEKFSHMRTAPRKSAAEQRSIGITKGESERNTIYYFLYDISSGGMGFLTDDPGEFTIGDFVVAHAIDGNPLPKALRGKVVAIRNMEESLSFKVGVTFTR